MEIAETKSGLVMSEVTLKNKAPELRVERWIKRPGADRAPLQR